MLNLYTDAIVTYLQALIYTNDFFLHALNEIMEILNMTKGMNSTQLTHMKCFCIK